VSRQSFNFVSVGISPARPDDWRDRAVCRDTEPDLHFPIGTNGPALLQTEKAKANCRRCPVSDECLRWALEAGVDDGIWGGMTEEERRHHKRQPANRRVAA
jgi:WhiB family redox-sensing transcriptional regulator